MKNQHVAEAQSAAAGRMELRHLHWKQINPAPHNPRVALARGDPDYQKLQRSLMEFGCVEPLVWNQRTRNLVGGHQRFAVLRAQGVTEFDVSVVDLPLEREQALNVALNKIQGRWDETKLAALLDELTAVPDFDVSLTGFDVPEISALRDYLHPPLNDDLDFADLVDEDVPPIIQPGDLIELGPHRLLCGDSGDPTNLARLLDGRTVDLLFTDPPYNVSYYGGARPAPQKARPKRSHNWKRIYGDNRSQIEYQAWLHDVLRLAVEALAPGAPLYLWNAHKQFGGMHEILEALGCHVSCVITWSKESFAIGYGDYNQQTEFCLYGWKHSDGAHRWFGPTNASTLWEVHRDRTRTYRHPTQKPLALAEQAIINSSQRSDLVLDLFLGSGTTLIAADGLDRVCYGMELDPHYCDGVVHRYLAYHGLDALAEPWRSRFAAREEGQS